MHHNLTVPIENKVRRIDKMEKKYNRSHILQFIDSP